MSVIHSFHCECYCLVQIYLFGSFRMQTNNIVRIKFKEIYFLQKHLHLNVKGMWNVVRNKLGTWTTMDVKVFNDSKKEVDEEAFDYLLT